jgi:hypothetical protein
MTYFKTDDPDIPENQPMPDNPYMPVKQVMTTDEFLEFFRKTFGSAMVMVAETHGLFSIAPVPGEPLHFVHAWAGRLRNMPEAVLWLNDYMYKIRDE